MATAERMTAERYYEITVEGDRKQLVDGRIVVNEPKAIHMVYRRSAPGASEFDVAVEAGRGDTLESPTLPGFALPVDELFEGL